MRVTRRIPFTAAEREIVLVEAFELYGGPAGTMIGCLYGLFSKVLPVGVSSSQK